MPAGGGGEGLMAMGEGLEPAGEGLMAMGEELAPHRLGKAPVLASHSASQSPQPSMLISWHSWDSVPSGLGQLVARLLAASEAEPVQSLQPVIVISPHSVCTSEK